MLKQFRQLVLGVGLTVACGGVFLFSPLVAQANTKLQEIEYADCHQPKYDAAAEGWQLESQTWTRDKSPYCLGNTVELPQDKTLIIEAGTVIKFDEPYQWGWYMYGARLFLNGRVEITGTLTAPVVFTSIRDDSYLGDTNADGALTQPAPGDWGSIGLGNATEKKITYAIFKYGSKNSWQMIGAGTGANIFLTHSIITQSVYDGVGVTDNFAEFKYNKIYNNARAGVKNWGLDAVVDVSQNWWGSDKGPHIWGVHENFEPGAQMIEGHFSNESFIYWPCLTLADFETAPSWRQNIQPGDILYDPYSAGVGHTGLYIGKGKTIEAQGDIKHPNDPTKSKVNENNIASWDYPYRKNVKLLRVKKPNLISNEMWNLIKQNAIDFAKSQFEPVAKPYDWQWYKKDSSPDASSWYCSELVWAAYFNQGIDLEYSHDPLGVVSPVAPVEIYLDDDIYKISEHMEYQGGIRDYVFLMILSPVEVRVVDPQGREVTKNNLGIPGATYLEDEIGADGHPYDKIALPNISGEYKIYVTAKAGAQPSDTYSLKIELDGQTTWLAQNVAVADLPAEPYVLTGTLVVGFNDAEDSQNNTWVAETLDAGLNSISNFNTTTPSQVATSSLQIVNQGSADFKYKIRVENLSGDTDLCNNLNLDNLNVATTTLGSMASTTLDLTLSLQSSSPSLQNKKCAFDLVATTWQANLTDNTQGFSDMETVSSAVVSGTWLPANSATIVLNEFLPNPDGVAYDQDWGQDADALPQGEWVELYNLSDVAQNLNGYYLTDVDNHRIEVEAGRVLNATTTIAAHGFLVVHRKGSGDFTSHNFSLNNDTDTINLYDSSGTLLDSYTYGASENESLEPTPGGVNAVPAGGSDGEDENVLPNKAYARVPDGTGEWVDPLPTPGMSNTKNQFE